VAELTERTEESNLKLVGSLEEPVVVEAAEAAEAAEVVRLPGFRERAFRTLMGIFRPWHLAAEEP
jgi:hypothetical protein